MAVHYGNDEWSEAFEFRNRLVRDNLGFAELLQYMRVRREFHDRGMRRLGPNKIRPRCAGLVSNQRNIRGHGLLEQKLDSNI
jgi:hypothetical protein